MRCLGSHARLPLPGSASGAVGAGPRLQQARARLELLRERGVGRDDDVLLGQERRPHVALLAVVRVRLRASAPRRCQRGGAAVQPWPKHGRAAAPQLTEPRRRFRGPGTGRSSCMGAGSALWRGRGVRPLRPASRPQLWARAQPASRSERAGEPLLVAAVAERVPEVKGGRAARRLRLGRRRLRVRGTLPCPRPRHTSCHDIEHTAYHCACI